MTLDECMKRIEGYLRKDDFSPRLINVQNTHDLFKLYERFHVGNNKFMSVSMYAKDDENMNFDQLEYNLSEAKEDIFITGLSTQLKLFGKKEFAEKMDRFKTKTFDAHVVIFCYQCEEYFQHWNTRDIRCVYSIEGEDSCLPNIIFVPAYREFEPENRSDRKMIIGIHNLSDAVEAMDGGTLFVKTAKSKIQYQESLLGLESEENVYEALCARDHLTCNLTEEIGTEKQWNYALEEIDKYGSWSNVIQKNFSDFTNLSFAAEQWKVYDEKKKWLYFISLKLNGAGNNRCLDKAVKNTNKYDELIRAIYRSIFEIEPDDPDFWNYYAERKELLSRIGEYENEILDYISILRCKEEYALYYLTDNTQYEREFVFELLSKFHHRFDYDQMESILEHVYPDLYAYLQPYNFKNQFLKWYFQEYKYQKVTNEIMPEFKKKVEEQATARDFNLWLSPRSEVIDQLDKTDSRLYFVDAMGVEYLGFILKKCREKNLLADVSVCRCELPSITKFNKEFVELFDNAAYPIKRLDGIKHHGEEGFHYSDKKLPLHLIRELEIIEEVMNDIRSRLMSGSIERAYMISDHGASRLAVINEHENQYEMLEKGKHCGRCCLISESDIQPESATQERGFWVLANYDRFKGSRPGIVEVHGGATLEEVAVPVIELTYEKEKIELMIDSELPIKVSYRKKANLVLFSKTKLKGVTVCVNGKKVQNKYYDASPISENKYFIDMPEIKYAGEYRMTVFSNNTQVGELLFDVKKEGASERSIL